MGLVNPFCTKDLRVGRPFVTKQDVELDTPGGLVVVTDNSPGLVPGLVAVLVSRSSGRNVGGVVEVGRKVVVDVETDVDTVERVGAN